MKKRETFASLKVREKKNKQKIIIDAAERVFGTRPFNKVNIRDIAREAGISHATIYSYFADQQALFVEASLRSRKTREPLRKRWSKRQAAIERVYPDRLG